ncbi:class I SAM-dependent methyltransferase [Planomicrobium sp. Y74]|uniref:class I SAM-dependent methyltransferase n=1 Tax=Planomicrobium sp. Y74 TaxID=2478977 RepID=UPI000EF549C7|nr:class I SAM-dependent methyltransferase [Planomicrobium sp. Y74]RLQ90063.1 class I SAM-dependent methyltransferase [Planomicrobium sp. Y74]
MKETIRSHEDLLDMLDSLLREPTGFWNEFYANRAKGIPFFVNKPDENLVDYFNKGVFHPGNVLELGSGPGRNAIYFAEQDCKVDAVDLSKESIDWAKERAEERHLEINFIQNNIFDVQIDEGTYDIVYDSGCFHHIAPHRRNNYIELVGNALKPRGHFAITCFIEGGELGGSDITDWEVYRQRSLNGGLGFTEEKLRDIFGSFEPVEIRKMRRAEEAEEVFGVSGLWTALFRKK